VQVSALKQQYFRWSKGGAQTVRKLFIPMAKSRMPLGKKLAGLFQMSSYLAHPLIILLLVTWLAIIIHPEWIQGVSLAFMSAAMLACLSSFCWRKSCCIGQRLANDLPSAVPHRRHGHGP